MVTENRGVSTPLNGQFIGLACRFEIAINGGAGWPWVNTRVSSFPPIACRFKRGAIDSSIIASVIEIAAGFRAQGERVQLHGVRAAGLGC